MEGTAHDGKVFNDALEKGLNILPGKYLLGDAGYALSRYVLTPYRGVRYHLKEWGAAAVRPQTKEEFFNLRHASLRNVIERIFGVMKKRFPILTRMPSYPYELQCRLVVCAMMLHNWIWREQVETDEFDDYDDDQDYNHDEDAEPGDDSATTQALNAWRDGIAQRMWDSYLIELNRRRNVA